MSKNIIIDWQRESLIVAVGETRGGSVVIDRLSEQRISHADQKQDAESASDKLSTAEGDSQPPPNDDATQALVRAVDELGLRKRDATVIVSRDLVEVRTIAVPRIDAAELPDVIRFQAQRQLANMGDSWTLDYVLLPDVPGQEMLTALVGAISEATLQGIESACEQAGITLAHVALRPIEIARFAVASGQLPATEPALIVCMAQQHADLLILGQGQVVQVRSTILPQQTSQWQATLSGELRRSLMAASVQLGNQTVTRALLIAGPNSSEVASELLTGLLDCPITWSDPTQLLSDKIPQRATLADHAAHRIVGIVGGFSLAGATDNAKIDFKNPKKRPPPQNHTRAYLLTIAAALLLIAGGVTWWYGVQREMDDQLARYRSIADSKKPDIEQAEQRIAQVQEIDRFLQASPHWLNEMVYMVQQMPPAEKVLVGEPSFTILNDGSGRITVPVAVDSSATIGDFESSLRDEQHVVAGRNSTQLNTADGDLYKWRVDQSITVKGSGWDLVSQLDTSRSAGQKSPSNTHAAQPEN